MKTDAEILVWFNNPLAYRDEIHTEYRTKQYDDTIILSVAH